MTIDQRVMKSMYALNFIRSTMAPEMRAAVMIANVPWYDMKSTCGMVPCASRPTPFKNTRDRSPTSGPPVENASE